MMRRKICLILVCILAIGCIVCGSVGLVLHLLSRNSIAVEYSKETYISVECTLQEEICGVTMTVLCDGAEALTEEETTNEGNSGRLEFKIRKDEFVSGTDFTKMTVAFAAVLSDGTVILLKNGTVPFRFGTDYMYEIQKTDSGLTLIPRDCSP